MRNWEYRVIDQKDDIRLVVDLRQEYGCAVLSSDVLCALVHFGGLVVGAYDARRLIGMAVAFPGRRRKAWILWSYIIGVLPGYRNKGIDFGLKQFQRTWALKHGYALMAWTLDPFQLDSAYFYFHQLGAVSDIYHVNFYGEVVAGINEALPSDRLEVTWKLRSWRVEALVNGRQPRSDSDTESNGVPLLKLEDGNRAVVDLSLPNSLSGYSVEIPVSFAKLKQASPDVAYSWYEALRETLQFAFSQGFTITDFVRHGQRSWYILSAPVSWFLYVLKCSDLSLYTGVTPDLERRLALHNAGRGAIYTASRRPVRLVAAWRFKNQAVALSAERAFKGLSRRAKLRIVNEQSSYHGEPFVPFE